MENASKLEAALVRAQHTDPRIAVKKIKTQCKYHPAIFRQKLIRFRKEYVHFPVPAYLRKKLTQFKSMDVFFLFIAWSEAYAYMPWEMYLELLTHTSNSHLMSAITSTKKRYGLTYNEKGGCIIAAINAACAAAGTAASAAAGTVAATAVGVGTAIASFSVASAVAGTVAATAVGVGTAIASSSVASAVAGGVISAGIGVATDAIVDAVKK